MERLPLIEQIKRGLVTLDQVIMRSDYRVLSYANVADGVNLLPDFAIDVIQGKYMMIKSFKIIPYANGKSDVFFNDTTSEHFTVPDKARLINVIDSASVPCIINLQVNGSPLQIFPSGAATSYPIDLFIDNIYYTYKEKISSLDVSVLGSVINDLDTGGVVNPDIRVLLEVYLF